MYFCLYFILTYNEVTPKLVVRRRTSIIMKDCIVCLHFIIVMLTQSTYSPNNIYVSYILRINRNISTSKSWVERLDMTRVPKLWHKGSQAART